MNKRSAIIIAIILMSIGFASISTTLIINGNAKVSENEDDFSVIFTAASIDGKDVYSTVVDNTKKTINFITPELSKVGDNTILTYEVTNNSSQYDANVNVTCVPKDGTTAKYTSMKNKLENDATVVKAKETLNGTLTVTLDKTPTEEVTEEYTCKLEFNAVERDTIGYNGPTEWTFDYTGDVQTFMAPTTGTYKLEVWGAQGYSVNSTYFGGYGAYSVGSVQLKSNTNLFIFVGQNGPGGYGNFTSYPNGGASYGASPVQGGSGGGSTHILLTESDLSALENNLDEILIVSGGGGASTYYTGWNGTGGHAGGYLGGTGTRLTIDNGNYTAGTGGSQNSGGLTGSCGGENGSFGKGGSTSAWGASGGGGFYGGGGNCGATGGGGSGYIGNSELSDKAMYCYNCQESSEESTKTISTTCTSATPTANCAKQGNGYARITLIK